MPRRARRRGRARRSGSSRRAAPRSRRTGSRALWSAHWRGASSLPPWSAAAGWTRPAPERPAGPRCRPYCVDDPRRLLRRHTFGCPFVAIDQQHVLHRYHSSVIGETGGGRSYRRRSRVDRIDGQTRRTRRSTCPMERQTGGRVAEKMCACMVDSIGPEPKRSVMACIAASTARSRPAGSRIVISAPNGDP